MRPEQLADRLNPKQWRRHTRLVMREVADVLTRSAKARAPRSNRSGGGIHFADTLQGHVTREAQEAKVTSTNKKLMGIITGGSKPHIITARNAKALHWQAGGAHHFARSVQHPGTQPNDFLAQAAADARAESEQIMQDAGVAWFKEVAR